MKKTTTTKMYIFFISLLCIICNSCEYDNNDRNFHYIEKPKDIFLGIDLAGVKSPDEIIYIYKSTILYYTLNTSGKEVIEQNFMLDGNSISHSTIEDRNYIIINPLNFDNQEHTLELNMALETGSGSLADAIGAERYIGEFKFKLIYVNNNFDLNIRQKVTEKGYLEILWDKPQSHYLNVAKYKVYKRGILVEEITDPDKTSFVDPSYIYGYRDYTIEIEYKESAPNTVTHYQPKYSIINEDNISLNFLDAEKVVISLKNPNKYACKYVLDWFGQTLNIAENETSVTLDYPGFPSRQMGYSLYILPIDAEYNDYEKYYESTISLTFNTPHIDNIYNISTNKTYNILMGIDSYGSNLGIYDLITMSKIKEIKLSYNFSTGSKVLSSETTGIGALDDGSSCIYIYKNTDFSEVIQTIKDENDAIWSWTLTNNEKIVYSNYNNIYIHDAISGKLIANLEGSHDYTVSYDGRYIITNNYPFYTVFELKENNKIEKIMDKVKVPVEQSHYRTFNPLNSDQLIIYTEYKTLIYNVNDFSLIKQLEGSFQSIDSYTGNILLKDKNFSENRIVHIFDSKYNLLYSLTVNVNNDLQLANNYLLQNNNYLNLSKILKK